MAGSRVKDFDKNFEFDDLELEEPDTSNLKRDERNARVEGSAGQIDFGKSSVTGEFKLIAFGTHASRLQPACAIIIDFNFSSQKSCRIEEATVLCRLGSTRSDAIDTYSDNLVRPKFIDMMPKTLYDRDPTKVNVIKGFKMNPKVGVQGLVDISLFETYKHESFEKTSCWTWRTEKLETHSEHDTIRFGAFASSYSQDGFNKAIRTGLLVGHLDDPFYIDFSLSAKVQYANPSVTGSIRRLIGKERKIVARRHFSPAQSGYLLATQT